MIYNNIKKNELKYKYKIILDFITNYEKSIEEQRMNGHEIHNDLLFLKSFKDKNTKEYDELINDLLGKYSKTGKIYKNLYNLPKGLKGIIHFKIYEIKNNNVNLEMILPKKNMKSIEKYIKNDYVDVARILSILLDNAIEGASKSKTKEMIIDFNEKEKNIEITIENSFKGKIDIKKIYNQGYSSKGKGRGYGLTILRKILDKKENLKLKQYIENNKFISELIIEKKSWDFISWFYNKLSGISGSSKNKW